MKRHLLSLILAATLAGPALATDYLIRSDNLAPLQSFFVSGVLKKNEEGMTIKLVHVVERASNAEYALAAFIKKAATEYPNYRILDAIVSPSDQSASSHDRTVSNEISI